ncbi:MAG: phenylalanine--tRNA ligase subunit beta [Patescibacteria group bacterium]|jgi:phenylalanyl-tRNA synthetase beta chain|nr:phenylalanine--tRNA ligase subunit beta [Patescibacteria group bacterium]
MNLQVSYNWLKEYVKIDESVQDFVKEFSLRSQTIDRIHDQKPKFKKVVTAKILEINPHPNADRLRLATVDAGNGQQTVVCGASNIEVGQIVPLALEGGEVIDDQGNTFTIKKAKIRDFESSGMLCSQRELGLGVDHTGIMILPPDTKIGQDLALALGLEDDYLLDIEITSNRSDAMSVVGLARDAAAVLDKKSKITLPQPDLKSVEELPLGVEIKESTLCPRYQAVVMTDVKVGPSPLWMQLRLFQSGMRPINNLVDITNYLILEYGRPMHVFDYDKINGHKIIVRLAKRGEKILALDGKTYELQPHQLLIADEKEPLAIGGVMGGELSAATTETKTIVFECAAFDPVMIRKTARELNLHSDSSDLFEKNLHPETTFVGILRAIELTQQLAGGKVASPIIDIYAKGYKPNRIKFDIASVKRYLGVEVPEVKIKKILEALGFEISGSKVMEVTAPYWRANDVNGEHDLIEEIARTYGYHNLPTRLPSGEIPLEARDHSFDWEDQIKNLLVGLGFNEVYNYSMISAQLLEKISFKPEQCLKIDNPLNEDLVYLRPTLISHLLWDISNNLKNFSTQQIFELSNIYLPTKAKELPEEKQRLTLAMVGDDEIFLAAKGLAELMLKKLGINDYQLMLTDSQCPIWQKGLGLDIKVGKQLIGQVGIINEAITNRFDIDKPVGVVDFDFNSVVQLASTEVSYQDLPEFPAVERDLSLVLDSHVSWGEIKEVLVGIDELVVDSEFISQYQNEEVLGKHKKNYVFRIVFRSNKRTLKSQEVDEIMKKVITRLADNFAAILR